MTFSLKLFLQSAKGPIWGGYGSKFYYELLTKGKKLKCWDCRQAKNRSISLELKTQLVKRMTRSQAVAKPTVLPQSRLSSN